MASKEAIQALNAYWSGSISADVRHSVKSRAKRAKATRIKKISPQERQTQRVLGHARVIASTMKQGQRKAIPRQRINGGKVIIEKGSGSKYRVFAASENKYNVNGRKKAYGLNVYEGSIAHKVLPLKNRHLSIVYVDKYLFNKWHDRLFTFKSGKQKYRAGKTGSMGG